MVPDAGNTVTEKRWRTLLLFIPPSLTITVMVAVPVPEPGRKVSCAVVAGLAY